MDWTVSLEGSVAEVSVHGDKPSGSVMECLDWPNNYQLPKKEHYTVEMISFFSTKSYKFFSFYYGSSEMKYYYQYNGITYTCTSVYVCK
jgi:hypothetical protein